MTRDRELFWNAWLRAAIVAAIAAGTLGGIVYLIGLTRSSEQKPWECHPYPGYCDINTDWRPSPGRPED